MAEELIAKHDTAEASVPVTASAESAPASLDAANTENKDETVDAAVEPSTAVDEDSIMASPTAEALNGDSASTPSTGKKIQRRKSGIPEHKGKKLASKKSMPTLRLTVQPGEHWFVRMKGYPPWPSIICDEEMLPVSLLSKRPVSAMRPDGSYREDFREGGKNLRDRRYPVMFLGTNEFGWQINTDLEPLDVDEVRNIVENVGQKKMSNALWEAHQIAAESHDLQYFKDMLRDHEQRRVEDAQIAADLAAAKEAAKEAKQESKKTKSKKVVADDDVEMADASEEPASKTKSTKKRKKDTDEATPKLKLKMKPTTEEAGPKPKKARKSKTAADSEEEAAVKTPAPEVVKLTPEERRKKREKTILYLRHRLQKGLISRETEPKAEEMDAMDEHLQALEQHTDLEPEIIRDTKANKLLKVILKLPNILRDEEFKFKERCRVLLERWTRILQSEDDKGTNGGRLAANGVEHGKKDVIKPDIVAEDKAAVKTDTEASPAANGHSDKDAPMESVETAPAKTEVQATPAAKAEISA